MTPRLSAEQKVQIPVLLAKGAQAYGFRGGMWTVSRVAEVIAQTFGVRYHRDQVSKLLREAGWSRQQPIERASQRDEEAIKQWAEERWPAIKKSRAGEHHHHLVRRSGILSVAHGRVHVGSRCANAGIASAVNSRSSLLHQKHYPRWATVPAAAPDLLRCCRCGRLLACPYAQDFWQAHRDLGRRAYPSGTAHQGLSQARDCQTLAIAPTAGVCPRS